MRIYFDHHAATPLLPQARAAMEPYLTERYGNPASLHQQGHAAREAIKASRTQFARLFKTGEPENILFTSSGTEAVNLAIKGAFFAARKRGRTHIVYSAIEHPAVTASIRFLETLGATSTEVPVDLRGTIDPQAVQGALRDDTFLVCAHCANHDLGTIQPLEKIGQIVADRGLTFFVDACAASWLPLDPTRWNAALMAVSPHRFYGPKGVGVLYRSRRGRIHALIEGGNQEDGLRAGTENVPAIVGAGVAADIALEHSAVWRNHAQTLQQILCGGILNTVAQSHLNGPPPGPGRHPGQLNISIRGVEGEGLALALDLRGVSLGAGAACVTKTMKVPPSLAAIGLAEDLARGTILLGLGKDNTMAEVEHFVQLLAECAHILREMSPAWPPDRPVLS